MAQWGKGWVSRQVWHEYCRRLRFDLLRCRRYASCFPRGLSVRSDKGGYFSGGRSTAIHCRGSWATCSTNTTTCELLELYAGCCQWFYSTHAHRPLTQIRQPPPATTPWWLVPAAIRCTMPGCPGTRLVPPACRRAPTWLSPTSLWSTTPSRRSPSTIPGWASAARTESTSPCSAPSLPTWPTVGGRPTSQTTAATVFSWTPSRRRSTTSPATTRTSSCARRACSHWTCTEHMYTTEC